MNHEPRAPQPERRRDVLRALALAVVTFCAYFASPIQKMGDAEFTVLVSEQLLVYHSFALDAYFWPQQPTRFYPGMRPGQRWPRQVQPNGARRSELRGESTGPLHYIYPHGSSILSLPFAAMARAVGVSSIGSNGQHDPEGERAVHRFAAATLVAFVCVMLFLTARLLLSPRWSLAVAVAAGFGTQLWSTASRSLQSHTWDVVLLSIVCFLLLRRAEGRGRARPVLLATLFAWAFFVRPTAIFTIAPLTAYVSYAERKRALPLLAAGAVWLALFVAYSRATFGTWLPDYYTRGSGFSLATLPTGLLGQLVSPSRGLFVFVPLVLVVAYGLVAYRRGLRQRPLVGALCAAVALHLVMLASFRNWWGGHCYGPRFSTDLVPLFALLGVLGLRAKLDAPRGGRDRGELAAAVLALLVGVALNGAGALSEGGVRWNLQPVPIGEDPGRAFDWRRSQWACAWFPALLPPPADGAPPLEEH